MEGEMEGEMRVGAVIRGANRRWRDEFLDLKAHKCVQMLSKMRNSGWINGWWTVKWSM